MIKILLDKNESRYRKVKVQLVTEDKDRIYLNSQQFVMRMDTPKSGSSYVAKYKREKAIKCNTCDFVSL